MNDDEHRSIEMMVSFFESENIFMFVSMSVNFNQEAPFVVMGELSCSDMELIDVVMMTNLMNPNFFNVGMGPSISDFFHHEGHTHLIVLGDNMINFYNFVSHFFKQINITTTKFLLH